ncbi:hypothetical protein [Chryseobacterium sp.]|uniref:HNH endonuclease n=1 Tax=Chryseobacterium sp. TaxID=1871047 RepID=UPI0031D9AD1C
MRHIPLPVDEHSEAFDACTSNFQDPNVTQSYLNIKQYVLDAGHHFIRNIRNHELSLILPTPNINGVDMKQAMMKLYTDKLAKKGQPGRVYYDRWRSIVQGDRCPLCSIKKISTLDHYLSKAHFPIYSIFPFNLVPACRDCNTEKLTHVATQYSEETLHPYFDDIDQHPWLAARIIEAVPASFTFYIEAAPEWSQELISRIEKHMEVLKLNDLFSFHAAEELSNIRFRLHKLFRAGGSAPVRDHLIECLEGYEDAKINSWQTAIYRAMSESEWFHSNGFLI